MTTNVRYLSEDLGYGWTVPGFLHPVIVVRVSLIEERQHPGSPTMWVPIATDEIGGRESDLDIVIIVDRKS